MQSDMEDTTTANCILELFKGFPCLSACTIRFGRRPDDKLRSLGRETSIILTTNPGLPHTRTLHFPFMSLPRELRLEILKYTSLSSGIAAYKSSEDLVIQNGKLVQHNGLWRALTRECCGKCTFTKIDCCRISAYAAYSTTRECRTIPLEVTLVSRQMYLDAADVLYPTNNFIFKESLTASLGFFQKLQPASLKLLRRVEFYFKLS
jgi:hypothetical protein